MTLDDGMDNPLPISKEGLLEALDVAIEQTKVIASMIWAKQEHSGFDYRVKYEAIGELAAHKDYLDQLYTNIKDDACSNYPPVVRKG